MFGSGEGDRPFEPDNLVGVYFTHRYDLEIIEELSSDTTKELIRDSFWDGIKALRSVEGWPVPEVIESMLQAYVCEGVFIDVNNARRPQSAPVTYVEDEKNRARIIVSRGILTAIQNHQEGLVLLQIMSAATRVHAYFYPNEFLLDNIGLNGILFSVALRLKKRYTDVFIPYSVMKMLFDDYPLEPNVKDSFHIPYQPGDKLNLVPLKV